MSSLRRRTSDRSVSLALLLVLVLFSAFAPALRAMPHGARHEVRHEIDQLEDRWRKAMIHADIPALDALLASDYMGITANGTLQTRDDLLATVRSGALRFQAIDVSDRKVRLYGTTALVTCRAEITGSGPTGDLSGAYRYTHVYAREANGTWMIVSFEASRIREDDRR
ncbi:MAG: nuclear transport factor 2 family protein [Terracidiphilus sp.]|nr:nuclear transport factor 2 family protein [Terracidiphilus sp.]